MSNIVTMSEKVVKARREHRCDYCNDVIKVGEEYHRQNNIFDGQYYTWRSHLCCKNITDDLRMFDGMYDVSDGLTPEMFAESVDEYIHEHHYDDEANDTAKDWQGITLHEAVLRIEEELNGRKNGNRE